MPNEPNLTDKSTNRSELTTGILNIVLGIVLLIDTVLIAIMAACCLLMSFSLFFLAAIPAFLITGALCIISFVATWANVVIGVGTVIASKKGGKILTVFPIIAVIADVAVIPANIVALVFGVYLVVVEADFLSIFICIIAAIAIGLAIASLILSIVSLVKPKDQLRPANK